MKSVFSSLNEHQKEVLNLIRMHDELSGAEIARLTGLQPSTIVYILNALKENHLVEFSKTGDSTQKGGKKPRLYKINAEVGYILGMELLLHKIKLSVIDFAGHTVLMQEEEYDQSLLKERLTDEISNLVNNFIKRPGFEKNKILGIGVAVPGLVNSRQGLVYYSRKLELENVNLKTILEEKLEVPVFICNDANAGVLGFHWFPEKGDELFTNVIYLVYNQESVNMGSGILIQNRLYEGISGGAGEILTHLPSLRQMIEEANALVPESHEKLHSSLSLGDIVIRAHQQHPAAMHVLEILCRQLAEQIIAIVAFMNPHAIVLGGDLSEHQAIVSEKIVPYVKNKIAEQLKHGFEVPVIKASRFGGFSVSMGAAAMVMNEYFMM